MLSFVERNLKDHPTIVTVLIFAVVAVHFLCTAFELVPNVWQPIIRKNEPPMDLYIAMLSVAALQASFAGVIIVFGLSTQPQAFRDLRVLAGKSLIDNWMSISYSGFISAGFALLASLAALIGYKQYAPWLFELSVLFCVHGVVRLLWLLKDLIRVVRNDDMRAAQKKNEL